MMIDDRRSYFLYIDLGLGTRWSCFRFLHYFVLFSFGDIRLGWLSCFVWTEKSFCNSGFLILGLSLNFFFSFIFFGEGGKVCIFFTRLDSRTYHLVWDRKCSSSYPYILVCANFYCLILLYLLPPVYRFSGVKWGLKGVY